MSNPYAEFLNLIPKQSRYIGKVVRIETDGTVEVLHVDNTSRTVIKGGTDSYSINDYVLIVDGAIQSKLANVQPVIEVMVI